MRNLGSLKIAAAGLTATLLSGCFAFGDPTEHKLTPHAHLPTGVDEHGHATYSILDLQVCGKRYADLGYRDGYDGRPERNHKTFKAACKAAGAPDVDPHAYHAAYHAGAYVKRTGSGVAPTLNPEPYYAEPIQKEPRRWWSPVYLWEHSHF